MNLDDSVVAGLLIGIYGSEPTLLYGSGVSYDEGGQRGGRKMELSLCYQDAQGSLS